MLRREFFLEKICGPQSATPFVYLKFNRGLLNFALRYTRDGV
jgi:hypothetical protein